MPSIFKGFELYPFVRPKGLGRPLKDYSIYIWVPYGLCMDTHPVNPKPVIQGWVPPAIPSPLRRRVQTLQLNLYYPGLKHVGLRVYRFRVLGPGLIKGISRIHYDLPPGSLRVGMGNPTYEQVRVFRSLHVRDYSLGFRGL